MMRAPDAIAEFDRVFRCTRCSKAAIPRQTMCASRRPASPPADRGTLQLRCGSKWALCRHMTTRTPLRSLISLNEHLLPPGWLSGIVDRQRCRSGGPGTHRSLRRTTLYRRTRDRPDRRGPWCAQTILRRTNELNHLNETPEERVASETAERLRAEAALRPGTKNGSDWSAHRRRRA